VDVEAAADEVAVNKGVPPALGRLGQLPSNSLVSSSFPGAGSGSGSKSGAMRADAVLTQLLAHWARVPTYPTSQPEANALIMKASLLGQLGALAQQQHQLESRIAAILRARDGRTLPPPACLGAQAAFYAKFVHPGTVNKTKGGRTGGERGRAAADAAASSGAGLDVAGLAEALCRRGTSSANAAALQARARASAERAVAALTGALSALQAASALWPPGRLRAQQVLHLEVDPCAPRLSAAVLLAADSARSREQALTLSGNLAQALVDARSPQAVPFIDSLIDATLLHRNAARLSFLYADAARQRARLAARGGGGDGDAGVVELMMTRPVTVELGRTPALAELFWRKALAAQLCGTPVTNGPDATPATTTAAAATASAVPTSPATASASTTAAPVPEPKPDLDTAERALFSALWHASAAPAARPGRGTVGAKDADADADAAEEEEDADAAFEARGPLAFARLAPHPSVPTRVFNAIVLQYAELLSRRGDLASAAMVSTHLVMEPGGGADPAYIRQVLRSG